MLLSDDKDATKNNFFDKLFNPILKMNDNTYLPAVFFLILTISGNYLAETFTCSTRKFLTNNFLVKHILLFSIIYFTNSINTKDKTNPLEKLKESLLIYVFFIMFSNMNLFFTIVGFALLTSIYITSDYVNYYLNNKKQINHFVPLFKNILRITFFIWTIIGFIYYLISKKMQFKKKFSLHDLFLSTKNCKI